MKKNPKITDATRQAFIDAFLSFYRKMPIERITVKDVALKAGYSRATFYKYFKDVYDVEEYITDSLLQAVRERIQEDLVPENLLGSFVQRFTEVIEGKGEYLSLLFASNHSRVGQRLRSAAVPFLMSVFEVGPDDLDARYALEFYCSGIMTLIEEWVRSEQKISVESLGELIKGILEEGILKQVLKG